MCDLYGTHVYTMVDVIEDNGDPNCPERKRFGKLIDELWTTGVLITTNLTAFEFLKSNEAKNLHYASPAFFQLVKYNFFAISVINLNAIFDESSDIGLKKLISYAEQNQKKIFTKRFYSQLIGPSQSKEEISVSTFAEVYSKVHKLLLDNKELIKKLKTNRNKIFAHFDKDFYLNGTTQITITLDDLKKLLKIENYFLNEILRIYNNTTRIFKAVNAADISNTSFMVDKYLQYQEIIMDIETNS